MFRSKPVLLLTLLAHSTRELLLSEDSLREALTLNYPQREEGTHMPLPYPLISPSSYLPCTGRGKSRRQLNAL